MDANDRDTYSTAGLDGQALLPTERAAILAAWHSERLVRASPAAVWARSLDGPRHNNGVIAWAWFHVP